MNNPDEISIPTGSVHREFRKGEPGRMESHILRSIGSINSVRVTKRKCDLLFYKLYVVDLSKN